ncbi:MAG TPA: D-glycero-beta-D-manno-heptose-7-phosphate kinase, partial [Bacteroidia bacterium]|nr:D-glycero-beta-D-manno-heptose-7-phosphate kinase [Bacteroidia bacterium]
MSVDYNQLFTDFNRLKVLVVGDVMIDAYILGKVDRISPEAPVPVVSVTHREHRLGGAANVALNVKSLGAHPYLCAIVGDDEGGRELNYLLDKEGINNEGIIPSPSRITTVKTRIIGNNAQMLRIDEEITQTINSEENKKLVAAVESLLPQMDVVVFEDYDKGVLNKENIEQIITLAKKHNVPTVVDPKKLNFTHYKNATLFKPNLKEIKDGLKTDDNLKDFGNLKKAIAQLKEILDNPMVMVTLSELGVMITDHKQFTHIPAHIRNIADVSGAGDTVVSVAALCLALGCDMETIAAVSNIAGGLVCEKVGVVPVEKEQLLEEVIKL